MPEFIETDAELTLSLEETATGTTANNLTTVDPGFALDARQGKVLDDKKLDKSAVANNLTTIVECQALDARQGKWLNENKVGFSDVSNSLDASDAKKVLSAAQGPAIKKLIADGDAALVQRINTTDAAVAENKTAIAGKVSMKTTKVTLIKGNWSGNRQTVSASGVTANNTVIVTAAPEYFAEYNDCGVRASAQYDGQLTFTCTYVPSTDLTAHVLILE